mmetsp:Transcript_125/g.220  ORF Transcript_125/g.220 Transcript_125/m.220 type:complete len:92 (+) Transcript_125:1094-1369(+)
MCAAHVDALCLSCFLVLFLLLRLHHKARFYATVFITLLRLLTAAPHHTFSIIRVGSNLLVLWPVADESRVMVAFLRLTSYSSVFINFINKI